MVRRFSGVEVPGGYVSPSAYQHYILAELQRDAGKPNEAIESYRRAIAADPVSAYLRVALAELWLKTGQLDLAREQADLALELDPAYASALLVKARLREQLDHAIAAEAILQQAVQITPPSEDAHAELCAFYERHRQADKALAAARRFVEVLPTSYDANTTYARLLQSSGQADRALAAYQLIVDRWPDRLEPRIALSDLLASRDRLSESIVHLEEAYRRSPDLRIAALLVRRLVLADHTQEAAARVEQAEYLVKKPDQWLSVAQMRLDIDEADAALAALAVPLQQTALANEARLLAADALVRLGRIDDALARLAEVKPGTPEQSRALVRRIDLLLRAGRCDDAQRELAQSTLQRFTKLELEVRGKECTGDRATAIATLREENRQKPAPELSLLLADLLLREGQLPLALEQAKLAQAKLPNNLRALLTYATLLSKLGRANEALALVEVAQGREPDSPLYAGEIGMILYEQRHYDRAERWLGRALRLSPDQPPLLDAMAEIQIRRGEKSGALALLRRALQLPAAPTLKQQIEQKVLLLDESRSARRSSSPPPLK